MVEPISSYIIKIASRCNLNCDYCYEYNMGDNSWRKEPNHISEETLNLAVNRIYEHAKDHELEDIHISLHGGEPLLVGYERFEKIISIIKNKLKDYNVEMGIQSNAVLINEKFLDLFLKQLKFSFHPVKKIYKTPFGSLNQMTQYQ